MSGTTQEMPPEVVEHIKKVLTQSRTYLAVMAGIYFWEYLTTLKREYQLVWKGPWTWALIRIAFIFNRHFGLLFIIYLLVLFSTPISPEVCKSLHFSEPAAGLLLSLAQGTILSMRTWGMWNRSRIVGIALASLLVAHTILQVICITANVPVLVPPNEVGCISNGGEGAFRYLGWLGPLIFDLIILVLTLVPVIRHWREGGRLPILDLILRDGIFYFFVVFGANLLNFIWFILPPTVVANHALHAPLAATLTAIMCSKIVLNTREEQVREELFAERKDPLTSFRESLADIESIQIDSRRNSRKENYSPTGTLVSVVLRSDWADLERQNIKGAV